MFLNFFTELSIWFEFSFEFNYQKIGDIDLRVICLRCCVQISKMDNEMMAHSESKWASISTQSLTNRTKAKGSWNRCGSKPINKIAQNSLTGLWVARSDSLSVCNPPRRQLSSETHQHFYLGLSIPSTGLTTNIVFICCLFILNH